MSVKIVLVVAFAIIAIALIVALSVYINKAGNALSKDNADLAKQFLAIIRSIAVAMAVVVSGAAASTLMTGCVAKRSITVQGTVINSHNPDSVRVIISSQESYTGRKKQ
jgi:outer membrane protein assembly factor BamE (lipoprotein component of BamABCDE complex)